MWSVLIQSWIYFSHILFIPMLVFRSHAKIWATSKDRNPTNANFGRAKTWHMSKHMILGLIMIIQQMLSILADSNATVYKAEFLGPILEVYKFASFLGRLLYCNAQFVAQACFRGPSWLWFSPLFYAAYALCKLFPHETFLWLGQRHLDIGTCELKIIEIIVLPRTVNLFSSFVL